MSRSSKSKLKRPWQEVAKEAQDFRDASLQRVLGISELFKQDVFVNHLPKNVMTVPGIILSPSDIQITEQMPEKLVKLLADGQLSTTDVTLAFLRRAAVAQRLVCCTQSPKSSSSSSVFWMLIPYRQIASQSSCLNKHLIELRFSMPTTLNTANSWDHFTGSLSVSKR